MVFKTILFCFLLGEASFPLTPFGLSAFPTLLTQSHGPAGRLMPTSSLRSSKAPAPLGICSRVRGVPTEYPIPALSNAGIYIPPASSLSAKCRTVAPVVPLHSRRQKQSGTIFFEGSKEVASVSASDLRDDLRQNRTNLLTLRASPPAPALALVGPAPKTRQMAPEKGKIS